MCRVRTLTHTSVMFRFCIRQYVGEEVVKVTVGNSSFDRTDVQWSERSYDLARSWLADGVHLESLTSPGLVASAGFYLQGTHPHSIVTMQTIA
jgi:hypothetical protein